MPHALPRGLPLGLPASRRYGLALTYRPPLPLDTPAWRRLIGPFSTRHPSGLLDDDGGVPPGQPISFAASALGLPLAFETRTATANRAGPLAIVIHAFYPDVLPTLLARIVHIPGPLNLFISTDTEAKRDEIERICAPFDRGSVEVRLTPNRGRDIAPKLVTFADVYARHELFLHLHTKRSPHADKLAGWSDHLTATLIGSPEIASSVLHLFHRDPKLGIVFPQHLYRLRKALRFGHNYDQARRLLRSMGVRLQADWPLDFPSGSMFFGRGAALKPLLDLGLKSEDFPSEAGQVDGTLAHAIERIVLHAAEVAGFTWLKVARGDLYPLKGSVLEAGGEAELSEIIARLARPCLPRTEHPADPPPAPVEVSIVFDADAPIGSRRIILPERPPEAILAGIDLWQRRDPVEAARWRIAARAAEAAALAGRLRTVVRNEDLTRAAATLTIGLGSGGTDAPAIATAIDEAIIRMKGGTT